MHSLMPTYLATALSILAPCFTYPTAQSPSAFKATKLRPIGIHDYEAALGLRRRDSEDFTDLDLQTQSQLIHGSLGGMC